MAAQDDSDIGLRAVRESGILQVPHSESQSAFSHQAGRLGKRHH
jgi:hypothetical protein